MSLVKTYAVALNCPETWNLIYSRCWGSESMSLSLPCLWPTCWSTQTGTICLTPVTCWHGSPSPWSLPFSPPISKHSECSCSSLFLLTTPGCCLEDLMYNLPLLVSSEIVNSMLSDSSLSPRHEPSTCFIKVVGPFIGGALKGSSNCCL